jgi:hypothetical protein
MLSATAATATDSVDPSTLTASTTNFAAESISMTKEAMGKKGKEPASDTTTTTTTTAAADASTLHSPAIASVVVNPDDQRVSVEHRALLTAAQEHVVRGRQAVLIEDHEKAVEEFGEATSIL